MENEIFQDITDLVLDAIDAQGKDWHAFVLNYRVDDQQSDCVNTFITQEQGQWKEISLPPIKGLDQSLRKLRTLQSQGGRSPFTSCNLHVTIDGDFNTQYGYDPIDWSKRLGWNFDIPNR
ncbi:hypothetical protein [Chitinimonas sp. JJ19]|uniref:hypothetical protein n=1 Tax=Chitinimonas sp. JJ19 TaxID=3109352 RepID=UPI001A5AAF65|nr:hypothetical protein [Chitinimonas sp.]